MRASLRCALSIPAPPPPGPGSPPPAPRGGAAAAGTPPTPPPKGRAAAAGAAVPPLMSPTASKLGVLPAGTAVVAPPGGPDGASLAAAAAAVAAAGIGGGKAAGSPRPRLLCAHPTLPICAYLLTHPSFSQGMVQGAPSSAVSSSISFGSRDGGGPAGTSTAIWDGRDQQIVLQDYARNTVLKVVHVSDVAGWVNAEECGRPAHQGSGGSRGLRLGSVRSLQFFDRHAATLACGDGLAPAKLGVPSTALPTMTKFRLPATDSGSAAGLAEAAPAAVGQADRVGSTLSPCGTPPSLMVQFDTRTVLLNLRGPGRGSVPIGAGAGAGAGAGDGLRGNRDPYRPLTALISPNDLSRHLPTSPATVVAASMLAIGCSDGTVRFFDMDHMGGKIVKSVRGPNGRGDPVVRVLNVNANSGRTAPGAGRRRREADGDGDRLTRILTVCASGVAFLWELHMGAAADGSIVRFSINPPLCRLDGLGEKRRAEINPKPDNFYGGKAHCSLISSTKIAFDGANDVVSWCVPNYAGVAKYHAVSWYLGRIPPSNPAAGGAVAPRLPPRAVVPLPPTIGVPGEDSAADIMSSATKSGEAGDSLGTSSLTLTHAPGSTSSIVDVVPGFVHPSLPNESAVSCLVVTARGDVAAVASSLAEKGGHVSVAVPFFRTALSSLMSSSSAAFSAASPNAADSSTVAPRVYAVSTPQFLPNNILLATSAGVMFVELDDGSVPSSAARHTLLAPGVIAFSGSRSQAMNRQRSPAALWASQGVVYAATVDVTDNRNDQLCGPIQTLNPIPVYRIKSQTNKISMGGLSSGASAANRPQNAITITPRLMSSPSGNFVCLWWRSKGHYEILHVGTLIKASRKSSDELAQSTTGAMVDSGHCLDFAWVGDEDTFAILHPAPEGAVAVAPLPSAISSIKKTRAKLKSRRGGGEDAEDYADDDDFDPTASKSGPSVELRVLVGMNADSVEISGSIAAATTTTLGEITLRGGLQRRPTALFGGPCLCVASLTYDRDGRPNGTASFYTRKQRAQDDDSRASSYGTVGVDLPNPDLVVWDEDGTLCAVIIGDRLALYRASGRSFALVGTAPISVGVRADCLSRQIESAKFLNGSLFVTTQSSASVIFLGGDHTSVDSDSNTSMTRGMLDSFVLAGTDVSPFPSQKGLRPLPLPMALHQPSILTLHGGSLLLSTATGIIAVPLSHPLLQIGILLGAGQPDLASCWFANIPRRQHEALATFLERRGAPRLAISLSGLSIETLIDLYIRHGFINELDLLANKYSVEDLYSIDSGGNGVPSRSVLAAVAINLLADGRTNTVIQIASDAIKLGENGRKLGLLLANMLLSSRRIEAEQLLTEIIQVDGHRRETATIDEVIQAITSLYA